MGKIRELSVRKVIQVLERYGFRLKSRGKHDKYYNEEKDITVPVPTSHGIITRGVIKSLIR
jgi:predicted RNA binding protein YcfA (HicA-like mRNA interferase family)